MPGTKNRMTATQLAEKYAQNCDRINAIAAACESEQRERNEAEEAEYTTLRRSNQTLRMRMDAMSAESMSREQPDIDKSLRDALSARKEVRIVLKREAAVNPQTTAALAETGIIAVNQMEMLKPLRAGLIWDKVGIDIRSGLVGPLRWPSHGKATAKFADEGERLADSSIDFSKLEVKPERMGVAIPITREELDQSEGLVEGVIREEMPAAITDLINEAIFTTEATVGGKPRKVYGPFVEAAKSPVTFAGAVPTRKELIGMKARVAKAGVKMTNCGWIMTEDMKAELEDTKVDAGSGRFVCENDMILGYPVFCTPHIGDGKIGFGDWAYQAAGFFGEMTLMVDPYTLARQNATDFVLNGHFATVTLRNEAFVLGQVTQ